MCILRIKCAAGGPVIPFTRLEMIDVEKNKSSIESSFVRHHLKSRGVRALVLCRNRSRSTRYYCTTFFACWTLSISEMNHVVMLALARLPSQGRSQIAKAKANNMNLNDNGSMGSYICMLFIHMYMKHNCYIVG